MRLSGSLLVMLSAAVPTFGQPKDPPTVAVVQPVKKAAPTIAQFVGRIEPKAELEVRPRVSGPITAILAKEGAEVRAGDVLFEIDSRMVRVEAARAEAGVQVAQAKLQIAKTEMARASILVKNAAISREEFEKLAAETQVAAANVNLAQSLRELALLQVEFARVQAPIAGRIGRFMVPVGGLAKANETVVVAIVNAQPCYARFNADERTLADFGRQREKMPATVKVAVGSDAEFSREAKIEFVDNQIDPVSGTIRIRALLPNADGMLIPGAACRVRMEGEPREVLMVPQGCIVNGRKNSYVFVAKDQKLEKRTIETGAMHEKMRIVRSGLNEGEWVVIDPLDSLEAGMTVSVTKKPAP